jgi:hypothetical protein
MVNTFLPYADFRKSAECLDYKRCGKQRVEAFQILKIVTGERTTGGFIHHPAVMIWRGYSDALRLYMKIFIEEWISRGYNNTMEIPVIENENEVTMPHWLGNEKLHASHRSNLLRKDAEYYGQFGWVENQFLEYYWPPNPRIYHKVTLYDKKDVAEE